MCVITEVDCEIHYNFVRFLQFFLWPISVSCRMTVTFSLDRLLLMMNKQAELQTGQWNY